MNRGVSDASFRAAVELTPNGMVMVDHRGIIVMANREIERLFGYQRAELLGRRIDILVPAAARAGHPHLIANFFAAPSQRPISAVRELFGVHKDGRAVAVEIGLTPIETDEGQFVLATVVDIQARQHAQLALRTTLDEVADLYNNAPCGYHSEDRDGNIVRMNDTELTWLGYRRAEVVGGVTFASLLTPRSRVDLRDSLSKLRQHGFLRNVQADLVKKDGSILPVVMNSTLISDASGAFVMSRTTVTDDSEHQRTQRAIGESAARLRALMDYANDSIVVLSPDGVVLEANHRTSEIFGRPLHDLIGERIDASMPPARAADRVSEFVAGVAKGTAQNLGVEIRRPDGTTVVVDFSTSTVDLGDETVVLSIGRDVTQQRQLERMYNQAQKMEAVGRLAGGIAHDFNNLLTVITTFTDLLLLDIAPDDPRRADITLIQKAAGSASILTRQLLTFTRKQVIQPRVLNLGSILAGTEKMLGPLLGEDIGLRYRAGANLGMVRIDPGQLEQIVVNLAVNARDAMPHGGQLLIETDNRVIDTADALLTPLSHPGMYVMLAVSDTGTGMDQDTQERLFEPFFTTKEAGKGTGLGLATVHEIVQQSGGFVRVQSELGRGTTLRVFLPTVDNPAGAGAEADSTERAAARGTETILVLDDATGVRTATRRSLERLGYRVLEAPDGATALQVAARFNGPIDLLVTDVVMPGLSGKEVADHLLAKRPHTKVLFVSGYSDGSVVKYGVLEVGLSFLQKPYSINALGHKVRQVLDERQS